MTCAHWAVAHQVVPCSLMASLNDMRKAAGDFSADRTGEGSTQEVLRHRGAVRMHGPSVCSRCKLGSVTTNHTSPWPTSPVWIKTEKTERQLGTSRRRRWPRKKESSKKRRRATQVYNALISSGLVFHGWESPVNRSDEIIHSRGATQWWWFVQRLKKKEEKKAYLRLCGVSVWQSPRLCPELLSHLGQSLKV